MEHTCFAYPVHVTVHLPFQLLFLLEQEESGSALHPVFLFGELSREIQGGATAKIQYRYIVSENTSKQRKTQRRRVSEYITTANLKLVIQSMFCTQKIGDGFN